MYPYIKKASDGKYHLYCGVCGKSNPFVQELPTGISKLYSIACNNKCSKSGNINQICGLNDIQVLAERYGQTQAEKAQMIRDICDTLELDSVQLFGV